jgi:ribosomal protein S1
VTARVVAATGAGVALELEPDLPGFARRGDMACSTRADPGALVGETVRGLVIAVPPERKMVLVSPRHLAVELCRAVVNTRRRVPVQVTGANRGGLLVDVHGLPGFLPRSELAPADALRHDELVGTVRRAYVIHVSGQQTIVSAFPPRVRRRRGMGPNGAGGDPRPKPTDPPAQSGEPPAILSPSASNSEPATSRASAIFTMFAKLGFRSPRSMPPTYVR